MRNKLIELLLDVDDVCKIDECIDCYQEDFCFIYRAADHLIANGVTVQQHGRWIPVTEALPKNDDLILCYGGGFCMCSFFKGKFYDFDENGYPYEVTGITHWMPLPEPPKESEA